MIRVNKWLTKFRTRCTNSIFWSRGKKIDAENELKYWARSTKRVTVEQLTEDIKVAYLRQWVSRIEHIQSHIHIHVKRRMCLHHSNDVCSHMWVLNAVSLRANGYNVWDLTKIWKLSNLACTECATGNRTGKEKLWMIKENNWFHENQFWSDDFGHELNIEHLVVPADSIWFTNLLSAIWCSIESK